ncbi:hypothetical protein A3196_19845 [Candidatus Thiodiazotropha endoloripes]|uniref:Uncharacterized protein n=1 Tax=Candidatus Thiodiazotropha endoloripes TaxID=1818881 RepID=A0A1E2UHN8_9GAMM|nr:hypothetical protein A3196_19845 [Candidatus Thiodiazotropha endoloripes]
MSFINNSVDKETKTILFRGLVGVIIVVFLGWLSPLSLDMVILLLFIPVLLTLFNILKYRNYQKNRKVE